jgi:uncharacterized damage-inducible protein DinB
MNTTYIRTLYDYHYWANRRVWNCVLQITDEQYEKPIGYSWGSIRDLTVHAMAAEIIWLSRFNGVSPANLTTAAEYPTRSELRAKWDEVERDFRAYLTALDDETLAKNFSYRRTNGDQLTAPLWGILAHVANHGTNHRSEVLMLLGQIGAPTIDQDMSVYLNEFFK